ncbi:B3/B4 domain-containing protein [Falsibacillus pallidus]|uniref:B3/B4 domain-containing protein n=1 Tax=Falsibacillus pallidus TaxID=493781 RepID=UPI001FE9361F|nr:phenylalanine--tRNA ligase beta subunit-related protein [Falsibacillus pallidus]
MEFSVEKDLCQKILRFKAGVIEYRGIEIGDSPQMLKGRLQLFQESIFFDLEEKPVTEVPGIKEWRQVFKSDGKDPNRYRHAAEALYRRIAKQNYLPSINSGTDLNNFFSLQYQVPIGLYDADQLDGDITIRTGRPGEEYEGLNGRMNSLENLILASDNDGPFGSAFVDSKKANVVPGTKNAVQIIFLRPSLPMEECKALTESLMNMFTQINGGEATFKVIGCE